jgi:hypothetical protein
MRKGPRFLNRIFAGFHLDRVVSRYMGRIIGRIELGGSRIMEVISNYKIRLRIRSGPSHQVESYAKAHGMA